MTYPKKASISLEEFSQFIEEHSPRNGLQCRSFECAFYTGACCAMKTVMIIDGECQQYNNKTKREELCPRAFPGANQDAPE